MKNLAGDKECDKVIREELTQAGIEIVIVKSNGEVPYSIEGRFKHYRLHRDWIYWVVEGLTPYRVARKIYTASAHLEYGKYKLPVRAYGHCGCPEPEGDVSTWHIDTQEGLNKFVEIVNKEV